MKKFELLRYIKKFSVFILLFAMLGSCFIYKYSVDHQQYTAAVNLSYTNDGIVDGYTPDGHPLDVTEIYSSTVVAQALEMLDISESPDAVRSRCSVTPVIPEEQQLINEALYDKGEESEYFPDEYTVKLVVGGDKGEAYARNVLDAIIQSYCMFYTEKYVEHRLSLNSSSDLLDKGYDYYECIIMLEYDTQEMLDYLSAKKNDHPDFRSSATGYTYTDLYEIYNDLKKYEIPSLYAQVIDGPQSKNGELIKKALSDQIKESERMETVKIERRDYLKKLIDNFSAQNKKIMDYHYRDQVGESSSTDYILKDVEDNLHTGDVETTYDTLILEYIELDKQIKAEAIRRDNQKYFLSIFQNVDARGSGSAQSHQAMEDAINKYEQALTRYYQIVNETSKEFNRSLSADYLKMESSIHVSQAINVKIYVALAVLFFLIVGVIGAIVLGRAGDMIDYFLYVDKKTGLANRQSCDNFIDAKSKALLLDNNTCMVFRFTRLAELSQKYGYAVGNNVLKDFAGLLAAMDENGRNVFHNDAGMFIAFFEQCNSKKAEIILKILGDQVGEYNRLNPDYAITYSSAYSTTTDEGIYEIRKLLSSAIKKLNTAGQTPEKKPEPAPSVIEERTDTAEKVMEEKADTPESAMEEKDDTAESTIEEKADTAESVSEEKAEPAQSASEEKAAPAQSVSVEKAAPAETVIEEKAAPAQSAEEKKRILPNVQLMKNLIPSNAQLGKKLTRLKAQLKKNLTRPKP